MEHPYRKAALGGTFDHLHTGHQALIQTALACAKQIVIGVIVDPQPHQKQYPQSIEPYEQRVAAVKNYCQTIAATSRIEIVPLHDSFGPTITDASIDCLVVSEMTNETAQYINRERIKHGIKPLHIEVISMKLDQKETIISSTNIRSGSINRDGYYYHNLFRQTLYLQPELRAKLQEPQGPMLASIADAKITSSAPVVIVGDNVIRECLKYQLKFNTAVVDGFIKRQPVGIPADHFGITTVFNTINKPGSIHPSAVETVSKALNYEKSLVVVDGEEDLMVFPAVLLSLLGSVVFYGQPNQGVVMLTVTDKIKAKLSTMIHKLFSKAL
jgi:pantetheine-phosphate adenylyltransferase